MGPRWLSVCRREGAALSSVNMLNGLVVGGRFLCLQFIEGAGFYVLTRGENITCISSPNCSNSSLKSSSCLAAPTLLFTL